MSTNQTPEAIDAFANTCERLNDFARDLRERLGSLDVRTGADIRKYNNGWRLEKYVEVDVDLKEGHTAAWWIDLGWSDNKWVVSASVSISHTDIHIELPDRFAENSADLRGALAGVIDELVGMTEKENAFGAQIRALLA